MLYFNKDCFFLSRRVDKTLPYICFRSKFKITKNLEGLLILKKGIYYRCITLKPSMLGNHVGSYVNSRKPNTRLFKKKKR